MFNLRVAVLLIIAIFFISAWLIKIRSFNNLFLELGAY
jgi:hypothetical protein